MYDEWLCMMSRKCHTHTNAFFDSYDFNHADLYAWTRFGQSPRDVSWIQLFDQVRYVFAFLNNDTFSVVGFSSDAKSAVFRWSRDVIIVNFLIRAVIINLTSGMWRVSPCTSHYNFTINPHIKTYSCSHCPAGHNTVDTAEPSCTSTNVQ